MSVYGGFYIALGILALIHIAFFVMARYCIKLIIHSYKTSATNPNNIKERISFVNGFNISFLVHSFRTKFLRD